MTKATEQETNTRHHCITKSICALKMLEDSIKLIDDLDRCLGIATLK